MADFPLDRVLQALLQNRMSPVLYETWGAKVRRFLAGQIKKPDDHPDVEDCVQATFFGVYRALKNKSDEELTVLVPGLENYLYETAANALKKFFKANSKSLQVKGAEQEGEKTKVFVLSLDQPNDNFIHNLIDENAENPEQVVEKAESDNEMGVEVNIVLTALPTKYKEVLWLRYLESDDIRSLAWIAQHMSQPEGTIKSYLSRATQCARDYVRIRKILQKTRQREKVDMNLLSFKHKQVILLHFYENLNWDEIAVQCNCPLDQAKKRLHRGIELLLHHWKT